ncbi:hypothetical protein GBF38_005491 [Nibea albiflora]|uniref:Uncharacterized protein n=1 Tax=Nibea albiflora TaxID=240163 RepID=A0ACB7EVK0_NIBAL|nr:hypothetical protein GBF38_005491 [Nibea albiflora]
MPRQGRKADQEEPDEGASGASGACAPGTKPDAKAEEKLDELAGLVNEISHAGTNGERPAERERGLSSRTEMEANAAASLPNAATSKYDDRRAKNRAGHHG